MTYENRDLTPGDLEQLIVRVSGDKVLTDRFSYWRPYLKSPERSRWAVDEAVDSHLLRSVVFPHEVENEYHFYWNGKYYMVWVSERHNPDGRKKTRVATAYGQAITRVPETLRQPLTEALRTFGVYGLGAFSYKGEPAPWNHIEPDFGGEG